MLLARVDEILEIAQLHAAPVASGIPQACRAPALLPYLRGRRQRMLGR
jgi:hypothetical protein